MLCRAVGDMYSAPPLPSLQTLNSGAGVVDPHVEPLHVEGGQAAHAGGGHLVEPALRVNGPDTAHRQTPLVRLVHARRVPPHALVNDAGGAVFVVQAEGSILNLYLRWLGGVLHQQSHQQSLQKQN